MILARVRWWRAAVGCVAAALAVAGFVFTNTKAPAQQGEPIKIGFSMALTGPLAPNGKQALLGMKIWEEEINAKGGLLGRPVKLIYYDDQSQSAPVPGIYTKLMDIDKVDLVIGPYATVPAAAAMPVVMQKGKVFIILFGLAVNSEFNYPKFFAMIPSGPDTKPAFTEGFFEAAAAQNPKPQTVALIAADQEFSRNACDGARDNAKKHGLKVVYDKTYPPTTTDFTPVIRAIQAANPDVVSVCSYPLDSVGIVKTVNELGYKPKMIGGAMVGLQATKSLDDNKLADHIAKTTFKTIMGDIKFGKGGEWEKGRMLQVQYHSIKSTELDQFRGMDTQTVLTPGEYKTGTAIYPYEKAKN